MEENLWICERIFQEYAANRSEVENKELEKQRDKVELLENFDYKSNTHERVRQSFDQIIEDYKGLRYLSLSLSSRLPRTSQDSSFV